MIIGVSSTNPSLDNFTGIAFGLAAAALAIFRYIDPLVAIIISVMVLKDSMSPVQILGG